MEDITARVMDMEDMVTDMVTDTEAMVIISMDTPVTTMITTITMTTITGERLLMARVWSQDQQVLLTLFLPGIGLEDPPWLSRYLDCLVAIAIITTPGTTATTTGDHGHYPGQLLLQLL